MQNDKKENLTAATRRNFALGASVVGLALSSARSAEAQTTGSGGGSSNTGDIAILNYALTLENIEANFYATGLSKYSVNDFANAAFAQAIGAGTVSGAYSNLQRIRDHEAAHVQALQQAITSLGGTPVPACTYNVLYANPDEFLQVALTLEETGVMAYNGAVAQITSATLKASSASIATVEARHASYLNLLNGSIPFPNPVDQAKMMSEILALVAPFLGSTCQSGNNNGGGSGNGNGGGSGNGGGTGTGQTTAVLLPKNSTVYQTQLSLDATQSKAGNGGSLSYSVQSIGGVTAAISGANTATPTVQFNATGNYIFQLTVTDSTGKTATDTTTIIYFGQ